MVLTVGDSFLQWVWLCLSIYFDTYLKSVWNICDIRPLAYPLLYDNNVRVSTYSGTVHTVPVTVTLAYAREKKL